MSHNVPRETLTTIVFLSGALAGQYDRAEALEGKANRYKAHLEVVAQVAHDNAPDPGSHKARGIPFRDCHNPACQRTAAVLRDEQDILRQALWG